VNQKYYGKLVNQKYIIVYIIIMFICYFTWYNKKEKEKKENVKQRKNKKAHSAHIVQQILAVDCRSDGSDRAHWI